MAAHLPELMNALAQAGGSRIPRGIPQAPLLTPELLGQLVQLLQVLCQNGVLSTPADRAQICPRRLTEQGLADGEMSRWSMAEHGQGSV